MVNACGVWAPQVSAMVGAFTPSVPVDHQHIALQAVDGHELPRDMPCFRDTDNLVYGRSEAGGGALASGARAHAAARITSTATAVFTVTPPPSSRYPRSAS